MIFNKRFTLHSSKNMEDIRVHLVGKHIDINNTDFEVMEKDRMMKVIPRAEEDEGQKMLPITHVELTPNNKGTKVNIFSKPRRTDAGGPYLLSIFFLFCVLVGIFFYLYNDESFWASVIFIGVGILGFLFFWLKLQSSYFNYVRKIKDFVKAEV